MTRSLLAVLVVLGLALGACGKYGSPVRPKAESATASPAEPGAKAPAKDEEEEEDSL